MFKKYLGHAALSIAVCLIAVPVTAQKSKDTARMPITQPFQGVIDYLDNGPESPFRAAAVFDSLITYDEKAEKYAPLLATE